MFFSYYSFTNTSTVCPAVPLVLARPFTSDVVEAITILPLLKVADCKVPPVKTDLKK
jgi:hypothetical protein